MPGYHNRHRAGRRRLRTATGLLGCVLLCLTALGARAHSLGESYSTLRVEGNAVQVRYTMRVDQLVDLGGAAFSRPDRLLTAFEREVTTRYRILAAGERCPPEGVVATEHRGALSIAFRARCAVAAPLSLDDGAFFDALPDHLHFVRLEDAQGGFLGEQVLDASAHGWALPRDAATAPLSVFGRYAAIGVDHIARGWDHLAFLASVLLLLRGRSGLVLAITGFTVGHSITLALAVLGWAVPDGRQVEALIGLTIALVAAEAVLRAERRALAAGVVAVLLPLALLQGRGGAGPAALPLLGIALFFCAYLVLADRQRQDSGALTAALTLTFGLIHGFGFAGSLVEIGLPRGQLALALLAFNLGIETGQLLIVAAVLVAAAALRRGLRWLRQRPPPRTEGASVPLAGTLGAASLCGLGLFWFVERAWG